VDVDDDDIVARISRLAEEEHALERSHTGDGLSDADLTRLRDLEVQLDRLWDLLRQRRARRHAGEDPELAVERPEGTVEGYWQ
jgi:hypothetical protein